MTFSFYFVHLANLFGNTAAPAYIKLNLSPTANLGTEESGHCESFKQESMYGLSAKKVAVAEKWLTVYRCFFGKVMFLRFLMKKVFGNLKMNL